MTALFLILPTLVLAGEHLWEDFDACATGSIADQPGWTQASGFGTQTGQITNTRFYTPSNSLELPWHAGGSSAVFTNLDSTYVSGAEHPVIRFSAKLLLENTNTPFQVGIRNSAAGKYLSFQNNSGLGSFGILHTTPAFIPLVTGFYVDVTAWYNRSNNTYRFDYDNASSFPWMSSDDPTTHTQFNQFLVTRLTNTAATTGGFFLDNVSVETFPPHVLAWWRCTSYSGTEFNEQLGTFYPAYRFFITDNHRSGASDPIWDGTADFHNEGASRHLVVQPAPCVSSTAASSNWTAEAVFKISRGDGNVCLMDWGTALGHNTNGAWINFGYLDAYSNLYFNLRDVEQTNADYTWGHMGALNPDGLWHHAAFVKSNATLSLYIDYQLAVSTNILLLSSGSSADGTYAFNTSSHASIGQSLNGGNYSGNGTVIDEVRISGKALALSEFLQPGQPLIVDITSSALLTPWELTMKGILGKTYHLETSSALGAAANWQAVSGSGFVANYTFNFIDISSVPKTNFLRVVRED